MARALLDFAVDRWLGKFAYRTEIGAEVFVVAGAATLLIALATVGYQAVRAASVDPAKSLRYK